MKKCPPGVICVENVTLFFIFAALVVIYILYNQLSQSQNKQKDMRLVLDNQSHHSNPSLNHKSHHDSYTHHHTRQSSSNFKDVLLDPYAPPLRNESPQMAINVSTNVGAVDSNYRQVGLLNTLNSKAGVIPLMGRPLYTNRDKWQYYTMSDQQNSVKLPISYNGKSCTNEYGCDRLNNGDTVYVEGVNEAYKITLYDNDTIRYLPML